MKTLAIILLLSNFSFSQIDDEILGGPIHEIWPTIKGGLDSLYLNLVYPPAAKKLGIEGKVYLIVDLDSLGNIINIEVARSLGYGCDEEAIRLIKTAIFNPGYMRQKVGVDSNGKKISRLVPYKCKVSVPIKFKL